MTINDPAWWPPMLRPLLDSYAGPLIRQTGLALFGFPPDVFGTTYSEFRQLSAALAEASGRQI